MAVDRIAVPESGERDDQRQQGRPVSAHPGREDYEQHPGGERDTQLRNGVQAGHEDECRALVGEDDDGVAPPHDDGCGDCDRDDRGEGAVVRRSEGRHQTDEEDRGRDRVVARRPALREEACRCRGRDIGRGDHRKVLVAAAKHGEQRAHLITAAARNAIDLAHRLVP